MMSASLKTPFVQFESLNAAPLAHLQSALAAQLRAPFFSRRQQIGRLGLNLIVRMLPPRAEIALVSRVKKRAGKPVYRDPRTFLVSQLRAAQHIQITPAYPQQCQGYVGLTFDIDYPQDFALLPYLLDDLVKHDLRATINLVTHAGYAIAAGFVRDVQQSGFEIGLHGDTHNSAFAFLPKIVIKKKLQRAIDRLGFVPRGFRTPALSFSRKLLEVLDELGFQYDSSLTTGLANYRSLEFPYVFRHDGLKLLEVPLFMQDYNFFVNNLYAEAETLQIMAAQIAEMLKISGVALINLHPLLTFAKKVFWQGLLDLLQQSERRAYLAPIADLLSHST